MRKTKLGHYPTPATAPSAMTSGFVSEAQERTTAQARAAREERERKARQARKNAEAKMLTLKGFNGRVLSVAWSPDGKQLATGSQDATAKVWDTGR